MKGYLYWMVALALAGCAYGVAPEQEQPHDAGILHAEAGVKDAKAPPKEAAVEDSEVDPPDVAIQTQCTTLPLPTGIPACDACLSASCCDVDQACAGDQDCLAFDDCVVQCMPEDGGPPDSTCQTSCEGTYPNGASELYALDECLESDCSANCQ